MISFPKQDSISIITQENISDKMHSIIRIKIDFLFVIIYKVLREMLKTEDKAWDFQRPGKQMHLIAIIA